MTVLRKILHLYGCYEGEPHPDDETLLGWIEEDRSNSRDYIEMKYCENDDEEWVALKQASDAVFEYEGYDLKDVAAELAKTHRDFGCELVDPGIYDCSDDEGNSRHPFQDHCIEVIDILQIGLEALFHHEDTE